MIDEYGQIIRRTPRPMSLRTNPDIDNTPFVFYGGGGYSPNLWERFNNFIGGIGNWIAETSDTITGILSIVIMLCIAIPFLWWLVSLGWLWGIIAGVFLGGIVYYATMIIAGIFIIVGNIVLGIIRYIFYNGITFLLTLALAGVLTGVRMYMVAHEDSDARTEQMASKPVTCRCTAERLNVRSQPDAKADVLGTLSMNQMVNVLDTAGGFGRITYNGVDGYVSMKYMENTEDGR